MSPHDTRHGTNAGYIAGCREACCRAAAATWARAARARRYLYGDLLVDSIGTRRRIQALMRLGWSTRILDEHMGKRRTYTVAILAGGDAPIHRTTADRINALYEALSMQLPPQDTRYQRQIASRCRNYADRQGWPPPLAWDDIDDPDEQPTDWRYETADRRDALRDLADMGLGITQAARRLHLSPDAVEKWCARHRMSDVYRRLAARESRGVNQHTEGVA